MGRIRVGTCSWTDPTLISSGRFYPPPARSSEARLQYYSTQFDIVEVDSTYYSMPGESTSYLWAQRTGEDFIFDIKVFRLFTQHPTPLNSLPKDMRQNLPPASHEKANLYYRDLPSQLTDELWRRFAASLLPLDTVGRLGVVLFQFPPWFYPGSQQLDYILFCKEKLAQYRLAIEFRNSAWLSEKNMSRSLEFLRSNDLPFVCVDEPQGFKSSVPAIAEATANLGLVRFHGRNTGMWERKGIKPVDRFNYLYSEEELTPWARKIRALAEKTQEMHVLFNNCNEDKAMVNARQMSFILRSQRTAAQSKE
jgi:uncharacterized protein YecE (DUF72 family)